MPRWLLVLLFALFGTLWWIAHRSSAPLAATSPSGGAADACRLLQSPGNLVGSFQSEQSAPPFRAGNATISPLAGFSVEARVLSREDYHFGRESDYSPTDLALGWGPMSVRGLARALDVRQGGRWYQYRWGNEGPPLAPAVIAAHSANMHMIPADATVAGQLAALRGEDALRLDGWLVRIDGDDGWHWQSSMTREDTGGGACELVLVCSIRPR